MREFKNLKIAVAGTGYVGLSIATLLSQHHKVTAVDIIPEKVELINNKKSPIQDEYIEKYLAEKELDLTATLDAKEAYSDADFVVIAAPTNYDSMTIDEYGTPILIEANVNCGSIWLFQMAHGCGVFGEKTSEILQWIRKMDKLEYPERIKHHFGD